MKNKYIDAEKLIAEIERRKKELLGQAAEFGTFESNRVGLYDDVELYDDLLAFITTLQQEQSEVDLEKEANECWDYVFSAIGWDENSLMTMNHKEFLAFARHFWNKGYNVRKEE